MIYLDKHAQFSLNTVTVASTYRATLINILVFSLALLRHAHSPSPSQSRVAQIDDVVEVESVNCRRRRRAHMILLFSQNVHESTKQKQKQTQIFFLENGENWHANFVVIALVVFGRIDKQCFSESHQMLIVIWGEGVIHKSLANQNRRRVFSLGNLICDFDQSLSFSNIFL